MQCSASQCTILQCDITVEYSHNSNGLHQASVRWNISLVKPEENVQPACNYAYQEMLWPIPPSLNWLTPQLHFCSRNSSHMSGLWLQHCQHLQQKEAWRHTSWSCETNEINVIDQTGTCQALFSWKSFRPHTSWLSCPIKCCRKADGVLNYACSEYREGSLWLAEYVRRVVKPTKASLQTQSLYEIELFFFGGASTFTLTVMQAYRQTKKCFTILWYACLICRQKQNWYFKNANEQFLILFL